jgi:hypothetical protein
MTRFGTQYNLSRSTGLCAHTDEPLLPGTPCIAALCERDADEGFDRLDFSISAWEGGARPRGLYSYWKTTVPAGGDRPRMLVDDDVLLDLFERLGDDERPQRVAFRFVLGLILMRKKQIRVVGRDAAKDGEPERWRVLRKGSESDDPPMELVNPNLADADVRELTNQLSEILSGDI